ncbi:hypothetical protein CDL12_00155 [Handroanthus impetiginosus]|uniref:Wall-associated receptor kinase galacturonan-binding domain-containing protein n=1 Tax=Handroanthus impetiginosus TaxID=429701 RepID=A0A2G9IBH3_9LAMI|nr:hypothetical protein CDL12_00155 [Handroanthus impetiginosus]
MLSQSHLLLKCFYYLFMIMICFLQTSNGKQSPYNCSPSACGHIRNISYPFRLRDDPQHCGDPKYQLSCENNTTTILYLGSQNYHVQAINYENYTIRLTDPAIKENDTCSFPQHSLSRYYLRHAGFYDSAMTWPIAFMSCPYPVSDSAGTLDVTQHCFNQSGNYTGHTYIRFYRFNEPYGTDIKCTIDRMTMASLPVEDENNNVSLSVFHRSLLYGFELHFFEENCRIFCYFSLPFIITRIRRTMRSPTWRPANIIIIMTSLMCYECEVSSTECEYLCTASSFCYYKYGNLTYGSL